MISPTGLGIRNDEMGQGHWGAPRGDRIHKGVDFKSVSGQEVIAPFDLTIERISRPNVSYLSGIAFKNEYSKGNMWYFTPDVSLIGKEVKQGEVIGHAQALREYYGPKMTNHIHFQFSEIDPMWMIASASILNVLKMMRQINGQ